MLISVLKRRVTGDSSSRVFEFYFSPLLLEARKAKM